MGVTNSWALLLGNDGTWRTVMPKSLVLIAAAALLVGSGTASAQNQPSDPTSSPPEFQSSIPNKPAIATVPEAATDTPGGPTSQTTGQAPNVSKKMGAEMDSAGDQRASPDEQ
jgi:hypothetical protein